MVPWEDLAEADGEAKSKQTLADQLWLSQGLRQKTALHHLQSAGGTGRRPEAGDGG